MSHADWITSANGAICLCSCEYYEAVPPARVSAVRDALTAAGKQFEEVPDLCQLAARRDPALKRIAESPRATIIACDPRAVRWLFAAADAPLDMDTCQLVNMREEPADCPTDDVSSPAGAAKAARGRADIDWMPWFPVIDYDRCVDCKQCMNFCLFGVYALGDDERVAVRNPANCKTNCPACARICPPEAIIFAKHESAPINGGEASGDQASRETTQVDMSKVLGGDVYATLRRRGGRGAAAGGADLAELSQQLGVPPELMEPFTPPAAGEASEPKRPCDCECDDAGACRD